MTKKRILIVGGVAGGASCAARLRRLDESAEILLFDRGPYVSFANCGLPYYVGNVIQNEASLLVADANLFRERFAISVFTRTEVTAIDREKKEITVRDLETGSTRTERYDALVLSPGAAPLRPPLPGIDLPGIFTVRSIPDSRAIRERIATGQARSAVVIGGGFIGLEMAENLVHRGLSVTILEKGTQVMPPLDPEVAERVAAHLSSHGITLALGEGVAGFEPRGTGLAVQTDAGRTLEADIVILAIGVRPDTSLAKAAGLELGNRGGIRVDDRMRTSDPAIWAVGDAVEVRDLLSGEETLLALAGPANRQGRIAADGICGRDTRFRGVQGTAICGLFGLQIAATGLSEKTLRRLGATDYEKIYLHPGSHASYYPDAKKIHIKLVFRKSDGLILGAQAIGEEGADRRIDVMAMAIQKGGTVYDLEEAELCYAPQFGGAKDPVNFAGMIAGDVLRGDMPIVHWDEPATTSTTLLDVREPSEFSRPRSGRTQHSSRPTPRPDRRTPRPQRPPGLLRGRATRLHRHPDPPAARSAYPEYLGGMVDLPIVAGGSHSRNETQAGGDPLPPRGEGMGSPRHALDAELHAIAPPALTEETTQLPIIKLVALVEPLGSVIGKKPNVRRKRRPLRDLTQHAAMRRRSARHIFERSGPCHKLPVSDLRLQHRRNDRKAAQSRSAKNPRCRTGQRGIPPVQMLKELSPQEIGELHSPPLRREIVGAALFIARARTYRSDDRLRHRALFGKRDHGSIQVEPLPVIAPERPYSIHAHEQWKSPCSLASRRRRQPHPHISRAPEPT